MKQPLLHKTLRVYVLFSLAILFVMAPLFYFTIESLYLEEADETLELRKKDFEKASQPILSIAKIARWNTYNRDQEIIQNHRNIENERIFSEILFDSLNQEYEPFRILQSPISIEGQPFLFTARLNMVETEDLIESIAGVFLGLMLVLLLGFYWITKRLSTRLWRPFYETLHTIETFEIDKKQSVHFSETNLDEFSRLNQAIEKLIARNTAIYNSQQEFIENAAHELQTPLAVFQGKVELLSQEPDLNENQSKILIQLSESVSRLSKLNKNLLLLSRIENQQFQQKETVFWPDILEKNLDFFREQAEHKQISLHWQTSEPAPVLAHPFLAEILFTNLWSNALKHNIKGGQISIDLQAHAFVFSNTGNPEPLPSDKLFQRFFKSNPSDSGTGLGLAIVQRIVELYGWRIAYHFENGRHFFTVCYS